MNEEAVKSILAGMARHALTGLAGTLISHGWLQSSQTEQFVGAGLFLLGIVWSWWQKSGQAQVAAQLRRLTNRKTTAAAVNIAQIVPAGSAVTPGLPARPL